MPVAKKAASKKAVAVTDDKPVYVKVGPNVRAKRVGDNLFIRINLTEKGTLSQTGRAQIIARTEGQRGFTDLSEIIGEDMGLNLICSKRVTKGKKKAARDDDEDED